MWKWNKNESTEKNETNWICYYFIRKGDYCMFRGITNFLFLLSRAEHLNSTFLTQTPSIYFMVNSKLLLFCWGINEGILRCWEQEMIFVVGLGYRLWIEFGRIYNDSIRYKILRSLKPNRADGVNLFLWTLIDFIK